MKRFIGLCTASLDGYFQTEIYTAALNRAREYGYGLLTYNSGSDLSTDDRYSAAEAHIFDMIDFDRLDGLIVLSETIKNQRVLDSIIGRAREHGVFVVCIDKPIEGCYNIQFNYIPAFEAIVRHVLGKHGCRVINVMGGLRNNSFSDERIDCCRRVMKEYGLELDEKRIQYGSFWSVPTLRAMDEFFESGMSMPDAFICCNDTMAMAVCESLKERGYAVPADVIVTGFDGVIDEQFHIPRLTTAKQGNVPAAEKAVDAIMANLGGKLSDNFAIIDHKISYTHSCGCKPIDYRESTGRIQVLFDMIQESANVDTVIAEMNEAISYSESIEEVSANVYSRALAYKELYYCLCINDNFMNISTDYSRFIAKDDDDSRSLILCEGLDGNYVPPYRSEKPQLLEEAMEKYGAAIFWAVHFSDMNIGYGAVTILPEVQLANDNGVMRSIPKYTKNINHALEIANSQSVMKKVIKELQTLYVRDHTGLFNRRGFYNEINRRIALALDDGGVFFLTVLSIDLDGLKTINDTYGHAEGDVAIKAIADALHSVWGENEICARFGGDEFIAASVCRSSPVRHAAKLENMMTSFLERFNRTSGRPYKVRASFGAAYDRISAGIQVDELIKRADDLMYCEKSTHEGSRYRAVTDISDDQGV